MDENNNIQISQVEIKSYEGINSYSDYYNKILKDNKLSYLVSPVMESKFKNVKPILSKRCSDINFTRVQ